MEAEMAYASVCQATDYDCWLDQAVTVDEVIAHMRNNVANVHRVIQRVIPMVPLGTEHENPASSALACALTTDVRCMDGRYREKYELLLGKYVDFEGHRR